MTRALEHDGQATAAFPDTSFSNSAPQSRQPYS